MNYDVNKNIWECQPFDTSKSFECFVYYREEIDRTLSDVSKKFYKKDSSRQVGEWSTNKEWVKRKKAYQEHLQNIREKVKIKALEKAQETLATELGEVLKQALKGIKTGNINHAQQKMISDWLDRAGMKPIEKIKKDITVSSAEDIKNTLGILDEEE